MGDVILTLPALRALREHFPKARVVFWANDRTQRLLEGNPDVDEIWICQKGISGWLRMLLKIRAERFDAAMLFFVTAETAILTLLANIPRRIGPFSKLWSLFLTERISQNRSRVEKHEADYNLDVAASLGATAKKSAPVVYLTKENEQFAETFLNRSSLGGGPKIGIHPGCAGSTRFWPETRYGALTQKLIQEGIGVVITAGPSEDALARRVASNKAAVLLEKDIGNLAGVIRKMDLFFSNSTGPLHLAVALGVPTISIYCPIRVMSPTRWGPYSTDGKHKVFCAENPNCTLCINNPICQCMEKISVDEVFETVLEKLRVQCA